ncbi:MULTISPECIES: DUF4176 domain-containing protein [Ligilactobacillus]|uniref:DUF4176 domain-containing protein n=1 Tax=Ligilactobacillus TaxID=2767887 RepID=UPI0024BA11A7|nr:MULTISPECIES: DUF4176 domain-containing protein [Ligilactobacillus]MDO3393647.1 DUF4176 domain-containing protein [Ligilactobacillus sp. 110_WCHN]
MVEKEYLPIGTIVTLKDARDSKYMITEYLPLYTRKIGNGYFDYGAVLYPNGKGENIFHFNNEDIEEIIFKGYTSEKLDKLKQELKNREKMMPWKKLKNNEKNKDPLTRLLDLLKK